MLQLALKQGEYVMVGDNVRICYDRQGIHKQIYLSFDAPKDVRIMRQKIHEEVLVQQAGEDTLEGQILAARFDAQREDRERAALARAQRYKERNQIKKEQKKAT